MSGKAKKINQHPQRLLIERDILRGLSYREIAEAYSTDDYKLSRETVRRYSEAKLPQLISKAELSTVEGIIDRITTLLTTIEELYSSICNYLEDPDNKGHICFNPQDEELKITYTEHNEGDKPIRKVATLRELLNRVEAKGYIVQSVLFKGTDPRTLLLKTTETLNRQLELLCKAKGFMKDTFPSEPTDEDDSMTQEEFINLIRETIGQYPEALEALSAKLEEMADEYDRKNI